MKDSAILVTGAPVPACGTGEGHTDNGSPPPNSGPGDMASGEIRGQIVAEN